jgi:hypothetical protein
MVGGRGEGGVGDGRSVWDHLNVLIPISFSGRSDAGGQFLLDGHLHRCAARVGGESGTGKDREKVGRLFCAEPVIDRFCAETDIETSVSGGAFADRAFAAHGH